MLRRSRGARLWSTMAVAAALVLGATAQPAVATGHAGELGEDVRTFGAAAFFGSTASFDLNQPIVGMAPTPSGNGYWEVAADGGIFAFGDARFFGSTGAIHLNKPIVGMAATPSGGGYWLVASDGGIFAFGDAVFSGSTGSLVLNKPVVGMAATPTGRGYWLVAGDGGIFAFGDAGFAGSTGGIRLNQPVTGMAATPDGHGYWLVASDGGIFAFGTAAFAGSMGGQKLVAPVVGMARTPSGAGYWLVAADGGVFNFGNARFFGSLGGTRLYQRAVGLTPTRLGDGYWIVLSGACTFPGSTADRSVTGPPAPPTLQMSSLAVTTVACFDRVTFGFRTGGPDPISFNVGYRQPPFSGPSGQPIPVRGNAFLVVRISPGQAHDDAGNSTYTGPTDLVAPGGAIREIREIEDFEGVLVWVIGLDRTRAFDAYSPDATHLRIEIGS